MTTQPPINTFSLPARCSIIAAANPIGGHYNKTKTVSENIKSVALLLITYYYIIRSIYIID